MATVVERSRTSARAPGSVAARVSRRPVGPTTEKQTSPTGLSSRAAARAGDAGDADAHVGAERRARAVGQRLGDLGRHGAVGARSAPGRRPASAALASFE